MSSMKTATNLSKCGMRSLGDLTPEFLVDDILISNQSSKIHSHPSSGRNKSSIWGRGYLFLVVTSFND
jgi:hypothetical protein